MWRSLLAGRVGWWTDSGLVLATAVGRLPAGCGAHSAGRRAVDAAAALELALEVTAGIGLGRALVPVRDTVVHAARIGDRAPDSGAGLGLPGLHADPVAVGPAVA